MIMNVFITVFNSIVPKLLARKSTVKRERLKRGFNPFKKIVAKKFICTAYNTIMRKRHSIVKGIRVIDNSNPRGMDNKGTTPKLTAVIGRIKSNDPNGIRYWYKRPFFCSSFDNKRMPSTAPYVI